MSNHNILLDSGTNELEVIEFILNYNDKKGKSQTQSFGINVIKVREIIKMQDLTKMPNQSKFVVGLFNLRNNLIPALDILDYLYGEKSNLQTSKMVIAEFNKLQVGLIVSDVSRIHRISWSSIVSPESLHDFDTDNSTVTGILKLDDRHILMIDVEKIVADVQPSSAIDNTGAEKLFENKPIVVTAEDSLTIRKLISERLIIAGFNLKPFNDGEQAWKFLEGVSQKVSEGANLKDLVNVVITDIEMPNLDGYTLTKKIKSDKNLSGLPVVIFSSLVNDEISHKGKAVGADAQLSKPEIGELLETVRTLLA
ncbi:MAG: chemotaxis protein [Candidatus Kapabacteria bacterium]|nr:chemotaxis protein [Candidatus Kapabacteria bacterium]